MNFFIVADSAQKIEPGVEVLVADRFNFIPYRGISIFFQLINNEMKVEPAHHLLKQNPFFRIKPVYLPYQAEGLIRCIYVEVKVLS